MGLLAQVHELATRQVIKMALMKKGGSLIPTSGDKAQSTDVHVIYLIDKEGVARFLVDDLIDGRLQGKWSHDGKNFTEERSLEFSSVSTLQLWIHRYYRGWVFYTIGVTKFLLYQWGHWPWIQVKFDRYLQTRFNNRKLPRQDQMRVLRYIYSETLKERAFQTSAINLLTHFYTVRWVHRPDQQELLTYYTLLLDSMNVAGDLEKTDQHGYRLKPQALNTISNFDLEDRRHNDNNKIQKRISGLTVVLMIVGIVQAGTMVYDTWWKSPEVFTVTIGDQPIILTHK